MIWKVLIADDDRNFRYAMHEAIPWEEHGFQVIAEAVHGKQALEILREKEAHILLTDMEMPVMNGVELTKAVKKQYPDMIVIALSAFDDFEFVKESMRLGAEDYILKQEFDEKQIISALEQLCKKRMEKLRRDFNRGKENEEFLAYLRGEADAPLEGSLYHKLVHKNGMTLCLAQSDGEFEIHTGNPLFFCKIKETAWVFIYQMPKIRSRSQWLEAQLQIGEDVRLGFFGKVQVALCDESGSFFKLPEMYAKAEMALQYAIYFPGERFLHFQDMEGFEKIRKKEYLYQSPYEVLAVYPKEGERILHEMAEELAFYKPEEEFVNGSFVNFYKSFSAGLLVNIDDMDMLGYYEGIKQKFSLEDKVMYTLACMEKCKSRVAAGYEGKHKSVRKALEYVYQNYAQNVSLQDIAAYVGLSENYLSNLFKREMNESMVSFINKVRIEKAKQLLENQNLKVNEIAEEVGFRNATYLSTMFKKVTGMSISAYRSKSKNTP